MKYRHKMGSLLITGNCLIPKIKGALTFKRYERYLVFFGTDPMASFYELKFASHVRDEQFIRDLGAEVFDPNTSVRELHVWLICNKMTPEDLVEFSRLFTRQLNHQDTPLANLIRARLITLRAKENFDNTLAFKDLSQQATGFFLNFLKQVSPEIQAQGYIAWELMRLPGAENPGINLALEEWLPTTAGTRAFEAACNATDKLDDLVNLYENLTQKNHPAALTLGLYGDSQGATLASDVLTRLPATKSLKVALQNLLEEKKKSGLKPVILSTMAKSGTMFLVNHLVAVLGLPRARLTVCDRVVKGFVKSLTENSGIVAEHSFPTKELIETLIQNGLDRITVHLRDPRQALVSGLHFREKDGQRGDAFTFEGIKSGFFYDYPSLSWEQKKDWFVKKEFPWVAKFALDWWRAAHTYKADLKVNFTSQKDLKNDPRGTLQRILDFHEVPAQEAARLKVEKTEPGKSHFRKGLTDEWRNVFSTGQQAIFWETLRQEPEMCAYFEWLE